MSPHRTDGPAIPFASGDRRAAPVSIAYVEDVVLEVLELLVRRLDAGGIRVAALEEEVRPALSVFGLKMLERHHGEAMVSAAANRIQNQAVARRTSTASLGEIPRETADVSAKAAFTEARVRLLNDAVR
jgi:hypothetical protein